MYHGVPGVTTTPPLPICTTLVCPTLHWYILCTVQLGPHLRPDNPGSTEKPLSVLTPPGARPRAWVAYSLSHLYHWCTTGVPLVHHIVPLGGSLLSHTTSQLHLRQVHYSKISKHLRFVQGPMDLITCFQASHSTQRKYEQ